MKRKISWKIGAVFGLVGIMSMGAVGITYACNWGYGYPGGDHHHTGSCTYTSASATDNYYIQGQPHTSVTRTPYTLTVRTTNAYPGYQAAVNFTISNTYSYPGRIQSISLQHDNTDYEIPTVYNGLNINLGGISEGQVINSNGTSAGTLSLTATDDLPADSDIVFDIVIDLVQTTNTHATVTLGNMFQPYTGSPLSPSVTTNPPGLSTSLTGAPKTNAGRYPVTVTITDPNYTGSDSGIFVIYKASQTITFPDIADKTYGAPPFTISATASSGLPVSFNIVYGPATISGNTITLTGAGTVLVRAMQAGNSNYDDAPNVYRSFTVNNVAATVTLGNLIQTYTGHPLSPSVTTNPPGLSTSLTGAPRTNAGSYQVTATITDPRYTGSATGTFIIQKANTTLVITSSNTLPRGSVNVKALLKGNGNPLAGETVTFTAGSASASDTTGTDGVATARLSLSPGQYILNASFAGDANYLPANATGQTLYVYQSTHFVIWGGNAGGIQQGHDYMFWGSQWYKQVTGGDYHANNSFKGYADSVTGSTWSTDSGNSSDPPDSIGSYISVIVSTSITKSGNNIHGNVSQTVVLKVDDPADYQPNPGHDASGIMVATVH